ncbi:unnamed protein product [Discosporangium mesarthrocarpum]
MFDWVHGEVVLSNEGWKKFYLQQDEEVPKPLRVSNKRFILKMIFLAAVARPRNLSSGVCFEGKIVIWPIGVVIKAQRASRSRARGDPVLRPVTVNGEKYKKIMIDDGIPVIKVEMPRPPGHTIFMHKDGAKPHTNRGVMEAIQADAENRIILETQPFNSPDLSVVDLGFFHYIQQLKKDVGVTTAEGLVEATLEAFDISPRETLEGV